MKQILVACSIACVLSLIAIWRTDFSLETIEVPLLQIQDPEPRNTFIWPKKFRYLNRGAQVFAFESEDGNYVLKFFNRNQLRLSRFLSDKELRRRKEKIRIYPESYRLAFQMLPDETGILALHQGKASQQYPVVEVTDKASRTFQIDLNLFPFVLQKKGTGRLLDRPSIDQFLAFHAKRIGYCIADGDRDIKRNYSWIGDNLLYIDPARFFYEERLKDPERRALEWWRATYRLREWLVKHAPEQVNDFDAKIQTQIPK